MTKRISVRIAGQERIEEVEINENTTAAETLALAGLPGDYTLSPAVGMPAFGATERIIDRVKDGGKVMASPPADAGE